MHVNWIGPCGLLALAAVSRGAQTMTVRTESGVIEGMRFGPAADEIAFLGVPYAAPPIGDLRWKPPQQVKKWQGVRHAKTYGPACPQLPAGWLPYIGWDEDCLYLNIWTTTLSRKSNVPVIVYLHGGSNTAGYSQITPLGPALSRLGVVVVSANYRLGPMGFLAHPALSSESPNHSSGNFGLLDQIQALEWVRKNISHFGGDPTRVTVMGQSAGAVDVCLLMASPLAAGLLQRAIMQSGDCQSTLLPRSREEEGERFANALGVSNGPHAAERLRGIPSGNPVELFQPAR